MVQRIVIVGAGFSGTVLAANLLRRPPPGATEIVLVERQAEVGRGVAYAMHGFPYLLNVPAGRLSADARYPLQFLSFVQRSRPETDAEDFVPRQLYGDYLQEFLSQARREAPRHVKLVSIRGEVTRIAADPAAGCLHLEVSGHAPLEAARVVLALGNPPPRPLPCADGLHDHPAYHDDPWKLPTNLDAEHTVLIVGNGLTMADVVYFFTRDAARAPRLVTLSRRGLIPLPQSAFRAAAVQGGAAFFDGIRTVRGALSACRALARKVEELGGDWREVVTFVRNSAPQIWQRFPTVERRRFVRHLQGHWDVLRHRLPLQLARRLERLRRAGRLEIHAGRIERMTAQGGRLEVVWQVRGESRRQRVLADAVVNATGPDYAIKRSGNPLLRQLRAAGLVCEDELELGLRTGALGACVGADGRANERLFYLGPMLRADHWEATAAAELRNHAEALAQHLARIGA